MRSNCKRSRASPDRRARLRKPAALRWAGRIAAALRQSAAHGARGQPPEEPRRQQDARQRDRYAIPQARLKLETFSAVMRVPPEPLGSLSAAGAAGRSERTTLSSFGRLSSSRALPYLLRSASFASLAESSAMRTNRGRRSRGGWPAMRCLPREGHRPPLDSPALLELLELQRPGDRQGVVRSELVEAVHALLQRPAREAASAASGGTQASRPGRHRWRPPRAGAGGLPVSRSAPRRSS